MKSYMKDTGPILPFKIDLFSGSVLAVILAVCSPPAVHHMRAEFA